MNPLFIIGAGALLSFRESSSLGSFARRRKNAPNVSDRKRLSNLQDLADDINRRENRSDITPEVLMDSSTVMRVSPKSWDTLVSKITADLDDEGFESNLSKQGIKLRVWVHPGHLVKGNKVYLHKRVRDQETMTELERILQFKHYQAIAHHGKEGPVLESTNGGAIIFNKGKKIWAGADYINDSLRLFPLDTPYENPFRVLHSHQNYVNDLITDSPEAAKSLIDWKIKNEG